MIDGRSLSPKDQHASALDRQVPARPHEINSAGHRLSIGIFPVPHQLRASGVSCELSDQFARRAEDIDDAGAEVGSGVYFYRFDTGGISETRKMILTKRGAIGRPCRTSDPLRAAEAAATSRKGRSVPTDSGMRGTRSCAFVPSRPYGGRNPP